MVHGAPARGHGSSPATIRALFWRHQATVSATAAFQITTLSGAVIASLSAGERVVLDYEETQIRITLPEQEPRIIPEPIAIRTEPGFFMIVDEIQPGNLYRGNFEFRYSEVLESAWLIDILPINDYLAGTDEVEGLFDYVRFRGIDLLDDCRS